MLKHERTNRQHQRARDETRADVFDYIERFHSPRMRCGVAKQDQRFSAAFKPPVEIG